MHKFLYQLAWHLVLPFIPLRLWWRGLKEPLYRRDWRQRFGLRFPPRKDLRPLIWVHAVSLGETRAARSLLEALQTAYPRHAFLITHMTATGRAAAESLYGEFAEFAFLPYDYGWAMRRFIRHYRPVLGLIMETEIWPALLDAAAQAKLPVALVNARMSEHSAKGYRKLGAFAAVAFSSLWRVGAQSDADAARLRSLGARSVSVIGNLKFDVALKEMPGADCKNWFGGRRVFLAASTREGEEALLLDALARLPFNDDVLVVIVPRHPQRFDEVAGLLKKRGLNFIRRSEGSPGKAHRIVLGDSMGEMAAYYAAADVAFIGGSLLPFGAQNFIEACAQGTPVILGPSTFNFSQAAESALAAGAAIAASNGDEILRSARKLFDDESMRLRMRQAALDFCAVHRGATARTLALIEPLLAELPERSAVPGRADD